MVIVEQFVFQMNINVVHADSDVFHAKLVMLDAGFDMVEAEYKE